MLLGSYKNDENVVDSEFTLECSENVCEILKTLKFPHTAMLPRMCCMDGKLSFVSYPRNPQCTYTCFMKKPKTGVQSFSSSTKLI